MDTNHEDPNHVAVRGDVHIMLSPDAFSIPVRDDLAIEGTQGPAVIEVGRTAMKQMHNVIAFIHDAKKALMASVPQPNVIGKGTRDTIGLPPLPLPRTQEL